MPHLRSQGLGICKRENGSSHLDVYARAIFQLLPVWHNSKIGALIQELHSSASAQQHPTVSGSPSLSAVRATL